MSDEREIERIRQAEQAKGRKSSAQIEAAAERLELLKDARELLLAESEGELEAFMQGLGVAENSPAWRKALQVWREYQRGNR